jgi:hypothetical protein
MDECVLLFGEEAAHDDDKYVLDDEFTRRFGGAMLNVLALSYPDLKAMLGVANAPLPRERGVAIRSR